jgi:hypothetical protein
VADSESWLGRSSLTSGSRLDPKVQRPLRLVSNASVLCDSQPWRARLRQLVMKLSLPRSHPLTGLQLGGWPQRQSRALLRSCFQMSERQNSKRSGGERRDGGEGVAMPLSSPAQGYRELAYRATDGLEIVLFWHQPSNGVMVVVSDTCTGAYFELDAAPEEALEVFNHPYSYAAAQGVPYDTDLLPCWPKSPAKNPAAARQSRGSERPL